MEGYVPIANLSLDMMRSRATLLSPLGMTMSAACLQVSTNSLCIGLTVVKYWSITDSKDRPLSVMSLCILLINLLGGKTNER